MFNRLSLFFDLFSWEACLTILDSFLEFGTTTIASRTVQNPSVLSYVAIRQVIFQEIMLQVLHTLWGCIYTLKCIFHALTTRTSPVLSILIPNWNPYSLSILPLCKTILGHFGSLKKRMMGRNMAKDGDQIQAKERSNSRNLDTESHPFFMFLANWIWWIGKLIAWNLLLALVSLNDASRLFSTIKRQVSSIWFRIIEFVAVETTNVITLCTSHNI